MPDEIDNMDLESILGDQALTDNSASAPVVDGTAEEGVNSAIEEMEGIDLGGGLEDDVVKQSSLGVFTNDSTSLLNTSMPPGSPVQRSLEDPTLDDSLLESIRNGEVDNK